MSVDKKAKKGKQPKKPRKVRSDKGKIRGPKTDIPSWMPTAPQKRLFEVLMNPENRHLSIKDLCAKANVSRTVYYKGFSSRYFVAEYKRLSLALITQAVAPIIQEDLC